jgi:hypothetical protein
MRMSARTLGTISAAALVVALVDVPLHAQDRANHRSWLDCDISWLMTDYHVSSSFVIRVSFHDTAVPGARVVLNRTGSEASVQTASIHGDTDSLGVTTFSGVPEGTYQARIENGLLSPYAEFEVRSDIVNGDDIELQWPNESTSVRSLRGRLVRGRSKYGLIKPLQNASVELLDLHTGQTISRTNTSLLGNYAFRAAEPGLYVLRIRPRGASEDSDWDRHDIAVELMQNAAQLRLPPLRVQKTKCNGLQVSRLESRVSPSSVSAAKQVATTAPQN